MVHANSGILRLGGAGHHFVVASLNLKSIGTSKEAAVEARLYMLRSSRHANGQDMELYGLFHW